jgi:hypothetical protein
MFKFTKKFQEINEIVEEIPVIKRKIDEEKKKLSLSLAIKKFSEKKDKTPQEINILNAMLAMNRENLSRDKSSLESKLGENVNHSDIGLPLISAQNSDKTVLLNQEQTPAKPGIKVTDELAKKLAKQKELLEKNNNRNSVSYNNKIIVGFQCNSLKTRNETKETNHAAVNSLDNDQRKFSVDKKILSSVKLKKSVQTGDVSSNNENRIDPELAAKLTKQRALLDKPNPINIEHTEKSVQKFINQPTYEVQLEQKMRDNIAAHGQTQNSDEDSFLSQKIKAVKKQLTNNQTTVQEDNLPTWAEINFLLERLAYSTNEKKDEDLEFRLDEKISHLFHDKSDEEFTQQAASIKNSYFYDKIVPILKTLKRHLPPEKFDLLNNEISVKNSEKQLDKKTFQELDLQANSFDRCLSIICEKNTSDETEGFDQIQMQLQELMKELEGYDSKQHENQVSKGSNDKKINFFKTPSTVSPIDNQDPVVVRSATLKP